MPHELNNRRAQREKSISSVTTERRCKFVHSKKCYIEGLVFSRLIMLAHCGVIIYSSVCSSNYENMAICIVTGVVIIAETAYLIFRNGGRDVYW